MPDDVMFDGWRQGPRSPLAEWEKAYFDTIKQVIRSPRPEDLKLFRMGLGNRDVAVIAQRLVRAEDGTTAGFQPLALLVDDELAAELQMPDGSTTKSTPPDGLEGAA